MRIIHGCVVVLAACSSARNDSAIDAPTGSQHDASTHDGHGNDTHDGNTNTVYEDAPGAPGVATHIELYSGDGQMVMEGWPGGEQIKILVTDDNHQPVPNVTVSFDVTVGDIAMVSPDVRWQTGQHGTEISDASGLARVTLRGAGESQQTSGYPSTIHASIPAGSVDVHALSTYYAPQLPNTPQPYITMPGSIDFGSVAAGSTLAGGLSVQISYSAGSDMGHGVPGVGMRFVIYNDASSDAPPLASCANATIGLRAGGTVFTDSTGVAACDVKVPSTPGNYSVAIAVGGTTVFEPYFFEVH